MTPGRIQIQAINDLALQVVGARIADRHDHPVVVEVAGYVDFAEHRQPGHRPALEILGVVEKAGGLEVTPGAEDLQKGSRLSPETSRTDDEDTAR